MDIVKPAGLTEQELVVWDSTFTAWSELKDNTAKREFVTNLKSIAPDEQHTRERDLILRLVEQLEVTIDMPLG